MAAAEPAGLKIRCCDGSARLRCVHFYTFMTKFPNRERPCPGKVALFYANPRFLSSPQAALGLSLALAVPAPGPALAFASNPASEPQATLLTQEEKGIVSLFKNVTPSVVRGPSSTEGPRRERDNTFVLITWLIIPES